MPTNRSRASYDTLISEGEPNKNFGDWHLLTLAGNASNRRFALLYFAGLPPAGATVSSATLRVWLKVGATSDWSGTHTITARRILPTWKESLITWNRAGSGQLVTGATNPASAVVTGGTGGQLVEFDVSLMMADVAAGADYAGIRLEVNTNGTKRIHSSESATPEFRPQLEIQWNRAPLEPTDLAPAGGRSVSVSHPVLTWNFRDREGDEQAELRVLISTSSAIGSGGQLSTNEFDSGWVVSDEEQLDLSTTAYAGVAGGATRYWQVRTKDVPGQISPWSDVEEFRRDAKGVFTVDSPLDGGTVDETTPTITTTLTALAQEALAYRLMEDDGTGNFVTLWDQPRFAAAESAGVAHSFNIPKGLIRRTGRQYRLRVWSWDTVDREGTPGDPVRYTDVATFTFVRSAAPSPVTALTVVDETPGVKLTWNRAAGVSSPDWFCLMVDGERVFDRIDPAEVSLGGDPIVYSMVWYGVQNNVSHTCEVEAVTLDVGKLKHSQSNATVTMTPDLSEAEVGGIWLVDDYDQLHAPASLPRRIRIRGAEMPDLQVGESSATFYPIGRRSPVIVVDAIRGLEGTVSGVVGQNDLDDPNSVGFLANWKWAKLPENVGRRWRLVFGDVNIPVQLGQAGGTHTDSHLRRHQVSVEVSQIAEFPE